MKQHEAVKAQIKRLISADTYPVGHPMPRLEVLAAQSDCSVGTVRRAIRDLIEEGVVESAKRRGTVVLRKPAMGRVFLVLSRDPHSNVLLQEPICTALARARIDVDIVAGGVGEASLADWCRRLLSDGRAPDALITIGHVGAPGSGEKRVLDELFPQQVHVQFELMTMPKDSNHKIVVPNAMREADALADFLLKRGHHRVSIFPGYSPKGNMWYGRIAERFQEQIEAAGGYCSPTFAPLDNHNLERLVREDGVTAYVAANDHTAWAICGAMREAGIRIPEDLSLIGRNDTPWAELADPPLTSVSANPAAMAESAVTAVKDFILQDLSHQLYEVTPQVVARSSTAAAPQG